MKLPEFFICKYSFFGGKILNVFEWACFRKDCLVDFYLNSLDRSVSYIRGVRLVVIISMFCRNFPINANSVDPDQMPRFAASDLGLHCFPCPFYGTLCFNWLIQKCAQLLY